MHPVDLGAWDSWRRSRQPLHRRIRDRVRPRSAVETFVMSVPADEPQVIIGIEARTPSIDAVLLSVIDQLESTPMLVGRTGVDLPVPEGGKLVGPVTVGEMTSLLPARAVALTTGHYLPVGAMLHQLAGTRRWPFVVAQHGVLTPFAPPLPSTCTFLAWSEADARFWSGDLPNRRVEIVGSALLAQTRPGQHVAADTEKAVFLGQLHGIELERIRYLRMVTSFCRETRALYRPHPSERDKLSQLAHRYLRARGVEFDRSGLPLPALGRDVVAVFSTGVLEAAGAGLPAWVYHRDPPMWLRDLWQRYNMAEWGGPPTPAFEQPVSDPVAATAAAIDNLVSA